MCSSDLARKRQASPGYGGRLCSFRSCKGRSRSGSWQWSRRTAVLLPVPEGLSSASTLFPESLAVSYKSILLKFKVRNCPLRSEAQPEMKIICAWNRGRFSRTSFERCKWRIRLDGASLRSKGYLSTEIEGGPQACASYPAASRLAHANSHECQPGTGS